MIGCGYWLHYFDGFYAFGGYFAWMGLHFRRFNGLRFLFGLKARQPARNAATTRLQERIG